MVLRVHKEGVTASVFSLQALFLSLLRQTPRISNDPNPNPRPQEPQPTQAQMSHPPAQIPLPSLWMRCLQHGMINHKSGLHETPLILDISWD